MVISTDVNNLNSELIELRRDFHRHPELGFEEFRTAETISKYLLECGLEVQRIARTGVVGILRGKNPGRTVLLRADMDALPVREMNEVEYRSVYDGKMHACGHDGHMAMLLVAAKILARHRDRINGNVKFFFQPNEENAGAQLAIDEGLLENPRVDVALGIHLWSPLESGKIGLVAGPVMAAHENFRLVIKGKGGHTSAPQSSVDPVIAATSVVQTAQILQTREIDVLTPTQVMFGKIQGGTAPNIIPEEVLIEGSLRYLYSNKGNDEHPGKRLERIVRGVCDAHRTTFNLEFIPSNSLLVNDPAITELVREAAEEVLEDKSGIVPLRCMAGDDFSEIATQVPSVFYFVGTGNPARDSDYPHHHPRFNIDEDTLLIGAEMHVRTAMKFLQF